MIIHLPLQTERLLLRDFEETDWEAVHCYASDPQVARYVVPGVNTKEDTTEYVQRKLAEQHEEPRTCFDLAMALGADEQLIGSCRVTVSRPEHRSGDIGVRVDRGHWGRGYATEAAQSIVGLGFEQLALHRITAVCDPRNAAAARVLEKVGMQHEGCLRDHWWVRGEWWDCDLYAILNREWLTLKSQGGDPSGATESGGHYGY